MDRDGSMDAMDRWISGSVDLCGVPEVSRVGESGRVPAAKEQGVQFSMHAVCVSNDDASHPGRIGANRVLPTRFARARGDGWAKVIGAGGR